MQLLDSDTGVEEKGIHPMEHDLAEIDAFIEAQLKTGVLLPTAWRDELSVVRADVDAHTSVQD